ncbi:MAG: DNA-directed RNA polymerase [Candidatus Thermoplasmatota archaeon]|jgi:DNA-directed RNA polymerase subunit E'|nr:DNA-directed RNA polymerase [Candidatus Thermoplasmatota archaeon]MCL5963345.1 DNA-directed RNA polymerase [Candidatus Thermoplasmatota archaeon]
MYLMDTEEEVVRIPPDHLTDDYLSAVNKIAKEQYEGHINSKGDVRILIKDVIPVGDGDIVHGDGGVYQNVRFESLNFHIDANEVMEGTVVSVESYGAFVSIGPLLALLHISQIMDDQLEVDIDNKRIVGKTTKKDIKEGMKVTVRAVMISMNNQNIHESKIGLTMRQPGLGRKEWMEMEHKKIKPAA